MRGAGEEEPILSEDGSLFVTIHVCALGKTSQQRMIRKARVGVFHVALRDLKQVAVQAVGVAISSTLLRELAKRAIPLRFLDWRGVPFADAHAQSRESARRKRPIESVRAGRGLTAGVQPAVEAKVAAQPVGVRSSMRAAGCVATRSRTSLKYRKGSTPASLHPWASV